MSKLLDAIAGFHAIIAAVLGPVLDFIDRRHVVRRVIIGIFVWQTVDAYLWAKTFAYHVGTSGAELALVIGAVTVPVTILSGALFKFYDAARHDDGT
jgi:hypothetical protein